MKRYTISTYTELFLQRCTVLGILVFAFCLSSAHIDAKIRAVASENELKQRIKKNPVLVALFYKNDKRMKRSVLQAYQKVSSNQRYDDADVVFVTIDVDQKGSASLVQHYAITQVPTLIVFDSGRAVVKNGKIAQLVGAMTTENIHNFIESQCGLKIKNLIEKKQKVDAQREEQKLNNADPYFDTAVDVYSEFPRPYARGPYSSR